MASKKKTAKKTSKPAKSHPWRSEMTKHGAKHEKREGAFEMMERGMGGYSRKRESYK